jgi:hypothetical protein
LTGVLWGSWGGCRTITGKAQKSKSKREVLRDVEGKAQLGTLAAIGINAGHFLHIHGSELRAQLTENFFNI